MNKGKERTFTITYLSVLPPSRRINLNMRAYTVLTKAYMPEMIIRGDFAGLCLGPTRTSATRYLQKSVLEDMN